MPYFFLNSDVLLIEGALKGALYNLANGEIYSISELLKKILVITEQGGSLDNISQDSMMGAALNLLEKKKLGYFSVVNQKPQKIYIKPPKPKLRMMWLALNFNCNLQCIHCYSTSKPGVFDGSLNLSDLFKTIKDAKENFDLECVQLIGGEPLLLGKNYISKIIEGLYRLNIQCIEIFTNGHLIDAFYLNLFKKFNVNVAISIYSHIPKDHDSVTCNQGSWKKTINAIEKIIEKGLKVRFGIIAMIQNQNTVGETASWLENKYGISTQKKYDVVRTCGRGNNKNIIPWQLFKTQHMRLSPDFLPISISTLERTLFGNICWGEQICVLPNGDITPCEMELENIQGNINRQSLTEILLGVGGELSQRLNKDKIEICMDCEYRYACWECRAMSHQLDKKKFSKPLTCMYNPYTGEWNTPPNNLEELFPKMQNN